ncbi:MAG: quinoprotein dehydrogenase-associated SoxYZ-like carrier [Betaproteobacteria bacterium]|jgi:sulfur-oxidizing protein SoxY|uniref:Quinoprotein dehydrogenase-associated SoxYZ-like carrier n=2 Tax=Burkholderiaceae TaxID=119060 RepID=A0ABX6N3K7_9BURK|nr:quinoprotein dehydrogenase-associated SoxYZ-like carrier [Alcaligenaceae bacterium]PZO16310.1 MAG: quinoprotein dehydrogenase-associated SoxYZ-like carrier [Betaproteobacteria bacterium]PZO24882.1 MAG: quinoprotein dehydrogenase-associated SoxYZ-like carrier [Betaproteobacteria bacterium]PZO28937.1 MAG: quinoprotein dehydrogenase-associated SoxYZ-like carrier [Betaproteobacteria bacterium]QJR28975.1 quinoprotein dehydrogenase-associated SoxYZ-like carrier [Limnobacter sp. SAORIC-580]
MMFSVTKQSINKMTPLGVFLSGFLLVSNFFASPVLAAPAELGAVKGDLTGGDPLGSMQWPDMKGQFFDADAKTVFDSRIKVTVPLFAEDAMNVPVSFDASALGKVKKIVVLVDRNPIRKVLEFIPEKAKPALNFRFKLEQASPIRVAALTENGVWHVGYAFIEASGGGCTVPGATRADGSWPQTLNKVAGKMFDANQLRDDARLRVQVSHPMDTGLVAGVPAFYIEEMILQDKNKQVLAKLYPFEPVSENPLFSFDFDKKPVGPISLVGRDNNGNRIDAKVTQ